MQKETEDSEEFGWNVPEADSEEAVDGAVSQDTLKERQERREFGSQKNNPLIAHQERLPSTLFEFSLGLVDIADSVASRTQMNAVLRKMKNK